jgi:hypothetical protein
MIDEDEPVDEDGYSPSERNAARDVLGWAGISGGWSTGGFTRKLCDAISSADHSNRYLLRQIYPHIVDAMSLYMEDTDGIEELRKRAL